MPPDEPTENPPDAYLDDHLINDTELGGALRLLAHRYGQDNFDWYANRIINMSRNMPAKAESPGRVTIKVEHEDRADGLFETMVEMVTGSCCGVSPAKRSELSVKIDMTMPGPEFEERMVKMFEERLGDRSTLRVQAQHREIVESEEVAAGPGLETLVVVDDLGRKLDVAGMAWGSGFEILDRNTFAVDGLGKSREDVTSAIVSDSPIDASKTYLVVIVEHPDEALRG